MCIYTFHALPNGHGSKIIYSMWQKLMPIMFSEFTIRGMQNPIEWVSDYPCMSPFSDLKRPFSVHERKENEVSR